jgi:hypothetical protein
MIPRIEMPAALPPGRALRAALSGTTLLLALVFALPACAAGQGAARGSAADSLPTRLSDAEFWRLVNQISETEGDFPSDNFTSNEMEVGPLSELIRRRGIAGGVYMGVGPEQNFSYMAAVRPKMAFIVDIRRQAMVQHLMYKAIFEMSPTRADFISLLFSRPKPQRTEASTSIQTLWNAFLAAPGDAAAHARNYAAIRDRITVTHGFALSAGELASLQYVYQAFFQFGPYIGTRGATSGGGRGRGGGGGGNSRNFLALTQATGYDGQVHTFLATEEYYRVVKDLHDRNLIVPVSGDFGGPRAIRAIGSYVASRGARITAFYLSNVEQYLFQDGKNRQFYSNVATLPLDSTSFFIRPYAMREYAIETSLCPMADFVRAFNAGRVPSNNAALRCAR